jgi:hypothetical protein
MMDGPRGRSRLPSATLPRAAPSALVVLLAASAGFVSCGDAGLAPPDGEGEACESSECGYSCVDRGFPGGWCVAGACVCSGTDAGDDALPSACNAVECHWFCVDRGSDYGECRGADCRCTPPLPGADADAGDGDGSVDEVGADDAAVDDAPVGVCTPGATESRSCGRCGSQARTCNPDRTWGSWGGCGGEGECSPGEPQTQACGRCGSQTRTCSDSCRWGDWGGCGGEGVCSAGETQSEGCGRCGSRTRSCTGSCAWGDWGGCGGEGECSPGETSASDCDRCSQRVCGGDCRWGGCGLKPGSECEWWEGRHYRCCGSAMWQYCLPSCVWSTDCAPCTGCC